MQTPIEQLPLELAQLGLPYPFSSSENILLVGILIGIFTFFILLVLVSTAYKSVRKQRNWDEEEDKDAKGIEEVYVEKVVEAEVPFEEPQPQEEEGDKTIDDNVARRLKAGDVPSGVDKEKKNFLKWMKKRRKYLKDKIKKLEGKQFTLGLSKKEETQKRVYEQEGTILQEELLNNEAFLKELKESADWSVEEAKKGTPSKDIKKKLIEDGYSEREIEIIRRVFKSKKEQKAFPDDASVQPEEGGSSEAWQEGAEPSL